MGQNSETVAFPHIPSDGFRLQVRQSTEDLRDDRASWRDRSMSAGVGSILCVILGVSGMLMPHLTNGSPYRDSYTVTHPGYYDYMEERILREEKALDEASSRLVLFIT